MESRHAIIVIKDMNDNYLQYYDNRWNSFLFLNCRVDDCRDILKVKNEIYEKIGVDECLVNYKFDRVHTKFSVSNGIDKKYHHYFYEVKINGFDKSNEFEIGNIKFKWFSYDELLNDKRIQEVNSDIVDFIKDI